MTEIAKLRKTRGKRVIEACGAYQGSKDNGADYKNTATNHLKGVLSIRKVLMDPPCLLESKKKWFHHITLSTDFPDLKLLIYIPFDG